MEPAAKTPLLHHKLEQILGRRGPDPGLARLQGGRRAVRVVPEGRAVPGLDRGAPPARRRAARSWRSTAASACWCAATSYGRSVSVVVALPRERFSAALRKRLQQMFLERFRGTRSTTTCRSARPSRPRIFFTVHVDAGPTRSRRCPTRSSRSRSSGSPGRGTTTCSTRSSRGSDEPAERSSPRRYAARFPEYYKTSDTDWDLTVDDVLRLEELENDPRGSSSGSATRSRASGSRG